MTELDAKLRQILSRYVAGFNDPYKGDRTADFVGQIKECTSQEWLSRFEKELPTETYTVVAQVLGAARRAAGLDTEGEK